MPLSADPVPSTTSLRARFGRTASLRRLPVMLWWVAGAFMAVAFLLPPASAGDSLGMRRFRSPEVTSATRVGQRFRMTARDFTAITVHAVAGGRVGGSYRLTLTDVARSEAVRHADAAAADLVRTDAYTFRFQPLRFSEDRLFEFEIAPSPGQPGYGVALWATKGERMADGALMINGTPRWASLAFEASTSARRPLQALFGANESRTPRWAVLAGLLFAWLALRPVLNGLMELSSDGVLAR